jgi:hypothetical protein
MFNLASRISPSQLFPGIRISNIEELQFRLRRYFRRHIEECEDEAIIEEENNANTNPNFMKEQDMNFRLYPFYINWKKLEANEPSYYRTFIHFGYFGASVYSSFKEKYPNLSLDNILFVLSSFISEYLLSKDNKDEASQKVIKDYFEKIPNLDDICELIKKKIIMLKEVPMILLVLKIYEINYMLQKNNVELEKVLKAEYLLGTYLTDEEYNDINKHYKGKINKLFKKLVEENGKEYKLPKTKEQYFNHIKYVYKKKIKNE